MLVYIKLYLQVKNKTTSFKMSISLLIEFLASPWTLEGQEPPQSDFNISNWLLMVLWGCLALQSSTEVFLTSVLKYFPPSYNRLESVQERKTFW